jgi:hypothetical protein
MLAVTVASTNFHHKNQCPWSGENKLDGFFLNTKTKALLSQKDLVIQTISKLFKENIIENTASWLNWSDLTLDLFFFF